MVGLFVLFSYSPARNSFPLELCFGSITITAISSITEVGPGYTLVLESSSVSATTFTSYMTRLLTCNPGEKEVYIMDNSSVHRKKDLIPLVHSEKNKVMSVYMQVACEQGMGLSHVISEYCQFVSKK